MDSRKPEHDEALSLCDIPFKWEALTNAAEPSPPDHDAFEFSSELSSEMCTADDVFLCGKIAPHSYRAPSEHRRSESLDGAKSRLLQTNRPPVDKRLLRRASSADTPADRMLRLGRSESSVRRSSSTARPKWWQLLTFGSLRAPVEMEMEDIRNRQKRRSPSTMLRATGTGEVVAMNRFREEGTKRRWKLLRVLSCNRKEAIAVG